ncbi:MAG: sensor domain-containing diguanylate cyclase, partial [Alphaproteobacteria bacterium]|nr:sensor domain-containing diguanylate cyclase [Alphaproteobacteria bacterium]
NGSLISVNQNTTDLEKRAFQGKEIASLAKLSAENKIAIQSSISIVIADNLLFYDVTLLPDDKGRTVFAIIKDETLEKNLRNVLLESRERYKDFVEASSDFAWETNEEKKFVFVSPRGALGYSAHFLVDMKPRDLFDNKQPKGTYSIFSTKEPIEDVKIVAQCVDGSKAYLLVSAMPLFDKANNWLGARGVCRDITEIRKRDIEITRAHERERLLSFIIRSFRDEIETDKMLHTAVSATSKGLNATGCQIFRMKRFEHDKAETPFSGFEVTTEYGETGGKEIAMMLLLELATCPEILQISLRGWDIMASKTNYNKKTNGALCLWRKAEQLPWDDDDSSLVSDISAQIGIAIEQITQHEYIYSLSRTDVLTGLFNRRAFFEEAERRFNRLNFEKKPFALMYVDLDNFKLVNDTHGHQKGDEALIALREILLQHTRPTDLIARLGGDEFAIWLENADKEIAEKRTVELLKETYKLLKFSGSKEDTLGFSIGLATNDEEYNETLKNLISRADNAMYQSKRKSKGSYMIAKQADKTEKNIQEKK